jgi:hypothetical protein
VAHSKEDREWRRLARSLRISYRQIAMARVLGWKLVDLARWRDRAGGELAALIEGEYGKIYGRADPYTRPKTLKERPEEKKARLG